MLILSPYYLQWVQESNTQCQQSVQVCDFFNGLQDNWLITQLINRTVNGTRLPQVSVTIELEQQGCTTELSCQQSFNAHVYETSSENDAAARNINNYRQVQRITPVKTTSEKENITITFTFNTGHSSFYFAIQDEGTCITITRLIVFYHVCPSQTIDLTHTPETIAPVTGSPPITVKGHCVEKALTEDDCAPKLTCSPGGIWTPLLGSGCSCEQGYSHYKANETCLSSREQTE